MHGQVQGKALAVQSVLILVISWGAVLRVERRAEGAFVATPWLLPFGSRITLKLSVPGYGVPLAVEAEVRWFRSGADADADSRPGGIGVQFVDPPTGVALCLAGLLQARAAR